MSHKNFDFQTSWNLCIPPLEPKTSSLFWLDTSVDIALTVNSGLFFAKIFVWRFFDFCLSWSLASVKSTWFKTFMSESIVRFKRPENQRWILKWKIRSVMEWKCSENINSPSYFPNINKTKYIQWWLTFLPI
jgi:hypothetical protein